MTPQESPWRERFRVRIGMAFGILFIWRGQPSSLVFLIPGLLVGFLGILIRQWAAGCLVKNDELATNGPYALVRNPLYLGSFLAAAGLIFSATTLSAPLKLQYGFLDRTLLFWAILWLFIDSIYMPKIRKEETILRSKFGSQFDTFMESVPALWPKISQLPKISFSTFRFKRWWKNREIGSLIGYLFISGIMILRYYYG